jgi:hypothetical protein
MCVHLRLASTRVTDACIYLDNLTFPETYLPGYHYAPLTDECRTACRDRASYTVTVTDNQVMCLPFMEFENSFASSLEECYFWLVLNKVRTEDNGQEVYRRVGMFTLTRMSGEQFPFEDWPVTRLTFI